MKAFLISTRILGATGSLFLLSIILYAVFTSYLPLLAIQSAKFSHVIWRSIITDLVPAIILCLMLLVPFSRITSPRLWKVAFALLCTLAVLFTVRNFVEALGSSDPWLSLSVTSIPICIIISQLSVILIQRLRRSEQAQQGAAANP